MSAPHSEPTSLPCRDPAHEDKHPLVTLNVWSTRTRAAGHGTAADGQTEKTPMASTRTKNLARAIQRANPGMKYTEALRHAEAGRIVLDPMAPLTEALADLHRAAGVDVTPISLHDPSESVRFDPLRVAPAEPREVLLDEWHDMRPSEESRAILDKIIRQARSPRTRRIEEGSLRLNKQSLSDIIDRLDSGGREPWPLYVGDDLSDWTPLALFPLENDGNLAVCGPSGAGHTATLRALARSALGEGWTVSIVGTKADEFRDLRERHPQRVTTLPGGRFVSEEEGRAFVEGMTPGTAREPRLFIIDNGDYLFDSARGSRGEEWVDALENLMTHPHTAVVLQSTFLDRRRIPAQIIRHLNSRLLLGHSPEQMQRNVFRDVVPPDSFDAFDFNQPEWTGTMADRGRGVLWDGERLVRILHDPLDLQGGRA